jgi:O-succinylbenzoate synthase
MGRVGYGEIAPIEAFGTESIEQAIAFCQQLPDEIDGSAISEIPDQLPTCQFGFESALISIRQNFCATLRFRPRMNCGLLEQSPFRTDTTLPFQSWRDFLLLARNSFAGGLSGTSILPNPISTALETDCKSNQALTHSVLLPTGEAALHVWKKFWKQEYRVFKLKIGVNPIQEEIKTLERLLAEIPNQAVLRLDANGGLTESETQQWLEFCEGSTIEFLEQPLPVTAFETMLKLADRYTTPIALDESVTTIAQLQDCYDHGWRGIFVIKPAIVGFPSHLRQFCQTHAIDTVFSSVFETAIARQAGLNLASELSDRAVGYGITHWFSELIMDDFDAIWNSL